MTLAQFLLAVGLQGLALALAGVWGAFKEEGKSEPARLAYWLAIFFAILSLCAATAP